MRYRDNWPGETEPFFPHKAVRQGLVVLALLFVLALLVFFAPGLFMGHDEPADPMNTPDHIKPEWYFLPAYQFLKLIPSGWLGQFAELIAIALQGLFVLAVLCLPFLVRSPQRDLRKQPILLAVSITLIVFVVALGVLGACS